MGLNVRERGRLKKCGSPERLAYLFNTGACVSH